MVRDVTARRVARALAVVLATGGLVSALPGIGIARALRAVTGYADLGYVPEQCGEPTKSARAINGDVVRVCQSTSNWTTGFFAGHESYPLAMAGARLYLSLPDVGVVFSGCC